MSTHSTIALKIEDSYTAVYCHFDGYPEGVGRVLLSNYSSQEKVEELLDLGDLSILGLNADGCTAYHRDKGEPWHEVETQFGLDGQLLEAISEEYCYLFDGGEWYCNGEKLASLLG